MSAIITTTLVRRYLLSMGYRRVPWGWTRSKPGFHEWTAAEAGFHHVDDLTTLIERAAADGGGNAHELCARLGMLAAAEMTREYALVEAVGVDPVAWEKARGA